MDEVADDTDGRPSEAVQAADERTARRRQERAARMAVALRANLQRRRAQARARAVPTSDE